MTWYPGTGRPPIFPTTEELETLIDGYFLQFEHAETGEVKPKPINDEKRPTITGLCLYCGFESRQSFYAYEAKPDFNYIIKKARMKIENVYEQMLTGQYPTGPIFALKNMGWKDVQTLDVLDERKRIADAFPEELKEGFEDVENETDSLPKLNASN